MGKEIMIKDDLERLKELLMVSNIPILVSKLPSELYEGAVILSHDVDVEMLNGHYEGLEYLPPRWLNVLEDNCKDSSGLLIINGINKINKDEQMKFGEILKYHKVSTFELPKNCLIIVTATDLDKKPIAEGIYSLLAHV